MHFRLKSKKKYLEVYNSTSNIPVWNFEQISSTGDLKHLCKNDTNNYTQEELKPIWVKIQDEYLKKYALKGEYADYLKMLVDIQKLYNRAYIEKKPHLKTQARHHENNLSKFTDNTGLSISQTIVHLEKYMGIKLDKRKLPLDDYKEYIEHYKQHGKDRK